MPDFNFLENLAFQVRRDILRMVHKVNSGHPGGSLGCTEFFIALYYEIMELKDDLTWMATMKICFSFQWTHFSGILQYFGVGLFPSRGTSDLPFNRLKITRTPYHT